MSNLLHQTAFFQPDMGQSDLMIASSLCFPVSGNQERVMNLLLLVPIAFGMLLVNIYPDIMLHARRFQQWSGWIYCIISILLDEWAILPSLIFLGVGAMTDFRTVDCESKELPLRCSSTVRYFRSLPLEQSAWDSLIRQQQLYPLSVERMDRLPSSLPVKLRTDSNYGTDCGGSIFLYVAGSDHSAADYETV